MMITNTQFLGVEMASMFGIDKPKPQPIIPPAPPPPTVDQALERQVAGDRIRVRRGRAATDLSGGGAGGGAVGVYRALGGV